MQYLIRFLAIMALVAGTFCSTFAATLHTGVLPPSGWNAVFKAWRQQVQSIERALSHETILGINEPEDWI